MAKKPSTTQVAARANTEVAQAQAAIDFSAYAGLGMENATQESFAIPFLGVLQKISPQCEETDAAYIPGSKAGMLFESVSKILFDGKVGVDFVQCHYRRTFLRWAPRGAEGGGFKGEIAPEIVSAMREDGRLVEFEGKLWFPMEDGTINTKRCDFVADTRNHYLILLTEDGPRECLLSLSSTQIKKSKQLMTSLNQQIENGIKLPTFATVVHATTALESNDKGQWHGINFALGERLSEPAVMHMAVNFYKAISAGTIKASYDADVHSAEDKF